MCLRMLCSNGHFRTVGRDGVGGPEALKDSLPPAMDCQGEVREAFGKAFELKFHRVALPSQRGTQGIGSRKFNVGALGIGQQGVCRRSLVVSTGLKSKSQGSVERPLKSNGGIPSESGRLILHPEVGVSKADLETNLGWNVESEVAFRPSPWSSDLLRKYRHSSLSYGSVESDFQAGFLVPNGVFKMQPDMLVLLKA